jgi:hypothetical protein
MPKRILLAMGTAVAIAGSGVAIWRASLPEPKQVLCERGPLDPGGPLPGGVMMSPEAAERAFNPPLVRPQLDVASDETIDGLWVRPGKGGEAYIVYESEMIVIVEPWKRKTWEYARDQSAEGVPGELIDVLGQDVYTIPPAQECFYGNAVFTIGGADVAVINGDELPFADVRRVTESIIETAPTVIAQDLALDDG